MNKNVIWLTKWINNIARGLSIISLFVLMVITAIDVIGRYLFSHPLASSNEISEVLMVLIVFLIGGYVTLEGHHVSIDVITTRASKYTQAVLSCITSFLSLIILGLMTWQMMKRGWENAVSSTGAVSPVLQIPLAPFIIAAAIGLLLMSIASLINFINSIASGNRIKADKQLSDIRE